MTSNDLIDAGGIEAKPSSDFKRISSTSTKLKSLLIQKVYSGLYQVVAPESTWWAYLMRKREHLPPTIIACWAQQPQRSLQRRRLYQALFWDYVLKVGNDDGEVPEINFRVAVALELILFPNSRAMASPHSLHPTNDQLKTLYCEAPLRYGQANVHHMASKLGFPAWDQSRTLAQGRHGLVHCIRVWSSQVHSNKLQWHGQTASTCGVSAVEYRPGEHQYHPVGWCI